MTNNPLAGRVLRPTWQHMRTAEGLTTGEQSQTGHMQILGGMTIHGIQLITNVTDPSKFLRVWLEIGGQTVVQYTGLQLKMIADYQKAPTQGGRYLIPFSDWTYRTREGIRSGELITFKDEDIFLKWEIAPVTEKPQIKGRVLVTQNQSARYFLPRVFTQNFDASASGDNDLIWKNASPARKIRRIHFKSDNLVSIKIYRDNTLEHEILATDNNYDLEYFGLDAQTGYFHFDPTMFGLGWDNLMPTHSNELKFVLNMSAPESIDLLTEMLEQVKPFPQAA